MLYVFVLIQELYNSSCAHVEQQYHRFVDDLMTALIAEKQQVLSCLDETRQRVCRQMDLFSRDNERCSRLLSELSGGCQNINNEKSSFAILRRASELQPLIVHMKRHRREYVFISLFCMTVFVARVSVFLSRLPESCKPSQNLSHPMAKKYSNAGS